MIKLDKSKGFWYNESNGNLGFDVGLLDNLAYQIYVEEEYKKAWKAKINPQSILIQNKVIYKKYYDQAKQMIREEKIKIIKNKCKNYETKN